METGEFNPARLMVLEYMMNTIAAGNLSMFAKFFIIVICLVASEQADTKKFDQLLSLYAPPSSLILQVFVSLVGCNKANRPQLEEGRRLTVIAKRLHGHLSKVPYESTRRRR
eukprot:766182-Hanusia_phi.AAC.4